MLLVRLLRILTLCYIASAVIMVTWPIVSYLFYPQLSKQICVVDVGLNDRLQDIDKVIAAFNAQGIHLTRSCTELTSIKLSYTEIIDTSVYAQTMPHGLAYTFYGQYYEVNEIFIPLIGLHEQTIEFSPRYKNINSSAFQLILAHEIGHALGAPHVYYDPHHIMYPEIDLSDNLEEAIHQIKEITYRVQRY